MNLKAPRGPKNQKWQKNFFLDKSPSDIVSIWYNFGYHVFSLGCYIRAQNAFRNEKNSDFGQKMAK